MTYGHFEKGKWVVDGNLSDCTLTLTEREFDVLVSNVIIGWAFYDKDSERLEKAIALSITSLDQIFRGDNEAISSTQADLIAKISKIYSNYMLEAHEKEQGVQK
jgi:hypothetical protein